MRVQEICHHIDQMRSLRAQLQDTGSPPEEITKLVGMRTLVFLNRIERLSRHKNAISDKLLDRASR